MPEISEHASVELGGSKHAPNIASRSQPLPTHPLLLLPTAITHPSLPTSRPPQPVDTTCPAKRCSCPACTFDSSVARGARPLWLPFSCPFHPMSVEPRSHSAVELLAARPHHHGGQPALFLLTTATTATTPPLCLAARLRRPPALHACSPPAQPAASLGCPHNA